MTRGRIFWAAYGLLAAIALGIAWKLFPLAIPLVNLDVTLSRTEAIARAEAIAAAQRLAPEGARSAARFEHDGDTQSYVELDGGGKAAFGRLVSGSLYAPYWWEVRIFKPGVVDEATIRFKPDGTGNGFVRRLAEGYVRDPATKALDAAAARALAEERATTVWKLDLAPYALLEQSQRTRPSGRVDHEFVYERGERLGEARIRIALSVAGDELVAIVPSVHIPESFERRFRELRSANDAIAGAATIFAGLFYGLGGCIVGALWLARLRWLLVRPALVAGFVVGGSVAAATLAGAAASWFGFDTAQSATTFWLRQAGAALGVAIGGGLAYALVFMSAESLARRAFPHQPQLWRLWSKDAGATRAVLGRTVGGYLFVPIELALIGAFYYASNRWFGWWQPSEVLTDPNILSSLVPALSPIALSLQAGFMEECLFRAVPLALGALIGERFGRRRLGIALAFVLQAVVFGGAHANYPGFPPYSRLVELIVPSMIWAAIFLRFGLLPTILLHATYDLALFSIPLYLVETPDIWVQRAAVIAAGLVPLVAVLWRRAQAGAWTELPAAFANGAWTPRPAAPRTELFAAAADASRAVIVAQRCLPALAAAGLAGWLAFTPWRPDVPAMPLDRGGAEAAAASALAARGVAPGPEWWRLSAPRLASGEASWVQHEFVWREAGPAAYRALVGSTLSPPLWEVRYAKFDGDVAARAEEWRVGIDRAGAPWYLRHTLPEARPGAHLEIETARALAEREISARFGLDPATLGRVAAEQTQRPARTDWSFTYANPRVDVGKGGEARINVVVAGDEVAATSRFVHVPEPWLRAEREREGRSYIARFGIGLLLTLAALAALVLAVRSWMRDRCDTRILVLVFAVTLAASAGGVAVMWPMLAMNLRTTEPVTWQILLAVAGSLLASVLGALAIALASGVGFWAARERARSPLAGALPPWAAGAACAMLVAGAAAFAAQLLPADAPLWPSLGLESSASPYIAAALRSLGIVSAIGVGLLALHVLDRLTQGWSRRRWLAVAALAALVACLTAARAGENAAAAAEGVASGLTAAAVVYCVLRFDARTIPGFVVAGAILSAAQSAALRQTAFGWIALAIGATISIAIGIAATRYVARSSGS